ncbi:MAG: hypothetical protein R3297_00900 [Desulfobulbales bacterium]|nr:hypothetical protein [Desulfobulbales bacterium]
MDILFLLSGPDGDIELTAADLEQPFRISPEVEHPFLLLGDYFAALQHFILSGDGRVLRIALQKHGYSKEFDPAAISGISIRSEKHGAFYHIASIEIKGLAETIKFACTTALSDSARASLQEEYHLLRQLGESEPDLLPAVYHQQELSVQKEDGTVDLFMVLGQWLDGYHEWHLSDDPGTGERGIKLWDYDKGFRFLSAAESYEVLYQAAFILTRFYSQDTFRQIYPWHHGAGDFIVRAESGTVAIKLITVRQYEPLVHFDSPGEADLIIGAIHFLLNLSLRMRLDRLDGIFEPVWFAEFAVRAAVAGFFAGLAESRAKGTLLLGPVDDLLGILRSFDVGEILEMYDSLLEVYADEDQDDFQLIREMLPGHAPELYAALQEFSLP